MALSDDLTGLAARVKEAEDHAAAARAKTKAEVEQDMAVVRASAEARADQLRQDAEERKGKLSVWWHDVERTWNEHLAKIRDDGEAKRRSTVLPAHLERLGEPRRRRDRRGIEPRRRRRARAARARDVRAVGRRSLQGLHRRRSAHAHARSVERAAQDSRGAAAARRVRLRDDRAAEDRAVRRAGAEPSAALRLQAHRPGRDSRSGSRTCSAEEQIDGRARSARGDRARRRRLDARRAESHRPGALDGRRHA